ncbi:MAG: 1-acyl-sn-glycerol-3-phosphate acyltransferase [Gemmatimonadetes bacterium]|nr:1-acyl-sn-glycerol-3-phosphate acyltransferase [Gemmatimonadota bacterium]
MGARGIARVLCRLVLRVLGVRVTMRGAVPRGGALLVANHLSWLDIVAIGARVDCTFVAKREVARWPVVGVLARALGVVFIDRTRKRDLLRAVPALEAALRRGQRVLLFAEGTTTDGRVLLPFKSALVEAAVRAGVPVVPLALRASCAAGDVRALCWIGDETLAANLPRVWALRAPRVEVWAAPALARRDVVVPAGAAPGWVRKQLTCGAHEAVARRTSGGALRRRPATLRFVRATGSGAVAGGRGTR